MKSIEDMRAKALELTIDYLRNDELFTREQFLGVFYEFLDLIHLGHPVMEPKSPVIPASEVQGVSDAITPETPVIDEPVWADSPVGEGSPNGTH